MAPIEETGALGAGRRTVVGQTTIDTQGAGFDQMWAYAGPTLSADELEPDDTVAIVAYAGSRKRDQWPPKLGVGLTFEAWDDAGVLAACQPELDDCGIGLGTAPTNVAVSWPTGYETSDWRCRTPRSATSPPMTC